MATEARIRAVNKYNRKTYKNIAARWKIDFADAVYEAVAASGKSLSAWLHDAAEEKMARDREAREKAGEVLD